MELLIPVIIIILFSLPLIIVQIKWLIEDRREHKKQIKANRKEIKRLINSL